MNDYWKTNKKTDFTLEDIYAAVCSYTESGKSFSERDAYELQHKLNYGTIIPEIKLPEFDLRKKIIRFWSKAKRSSTRERILRIIDKTYFRIDEIAVIATAIHEALNYIDDNCNLVSGERVGLTAKVIDRRTRVIDSYAGDFQEMIYDVYLLSDSGTMYMTSTKSKFVSDCLIGNTLSIRATFEGFIRRENNKNLYCLKRCVVK